MPETTLSSKNQITLPAEMVRTLGLKGGDKLAVALVDDHVVLMPKPKNWAGYWHGRLKGVYGSTVEEVDLYIAEVRAGEEDLATLDALLSQRPDLLRVLTVLRENALTVRKLAKAISGTQEDVKRNLEALEKLGLTRSSQREDETLHRLTGRGRLALDRQS
jgi:AbrB family looped-hinge helix DNA binding protein